MKMIDFRDKYRSLFRNNEFMWCKYCNWYVSKSSKHCRACNRCTCNFDHHCRWLNNCVSQQNYKSFFISCCATESLLLYEIILGILFITNKIDASNHLFIKFKNVTFILIALHTFISIFLAIPLAQLIAFHIYLHNKKITTYDWVVSNEEKAQQKMEQRRKKKQSRNKYAKKENADKSHKSFVKDEDDDIDKDEKESMDSVSRNDEEPRSNRNIKEKLISISKRSIKRGLRKYFYSLRDCEYKFNQKNVSQNNIKREDTNKTVIQELQLEANTDVKLSGLATDDTLQTHTEEISNTLSTDSDILCSIKICHWNGNGKIRKPNSVYVSSKYSQENQQCEKQDGLELVQSQKPAINSADAEMDDVTETEMVTITNDNQKQHVTPISAKHMDHPNLIQ